MKGSRVLFYAQVLDSWGLKSLKTHMEKQRVYGGVRSDAMSGVMR